MKHILAAIALFGLASQAEAACVSPITGNDAGGTSRTFGVTLDGSSNCYGNVALVDGANAANKMTVKAASTAPVAADLAAVVTLSQNAGLGSATTPMQVSLANTGANATAVLVNQPTAANLNATVVQGTGSNLHTVVDSGTVTTVSTVTNLAQMNGAALLMGNGVTGTGSQRVTIASDNTAFAVNSTLSAETTKVIGTVRNLGNAGAIFDGATGAAVPANVLYLGANNAGNLVGLPGDGTSGLWVNIKAGAGSGGTAIADNAAFALGTTNETPIGCYNGTATTTAAHVGIVACTAVGSVHTTVDNANANGSATSSNSSPVVIASDQAAVAVKAASGAYASGAFASGSIASGALASGSIASGAAVSGSFVAGAIADLAHGQGTMSASVPVTIASNQSNLPSNLVPATTGGLTNFVLEPTASDNHTVIKNGAGQVYGIHIWNNSATINYGRLYNAGTGFNGCNSATSLAYEFHIPASTSDAGFVVPIPQGIAFATGISLCVTSAYGQTNTTSATASAMSLNVMYN